MQIPVYAAHFTPCVLLLYVMIYVQLCMVAEEVGESKTMETPTKPKEAKEGNSSDKMLHR